jgi:hypothetical protein
VICLPDNAQQPQASARVANQAFREIGQIHSGPVNETLLVSDLISIHKQNSKQRGMAKHIRFRQKRLKHYFLKMVTGTLHMIGDFQACDPLLGQAGCNSYIASICSVQNIIPVRLFKKTTFFSLAPFKTYQPIETRNNIDQ